MNPNHQQHYPNQPHYGQYPPHQQGYYPNQQQYPHAQPGYPPQGYPLAQGYPAAYPHNQQQVPPGGAYHNPPPVGHYPSHPPQGYPHQQHHYPPQQHQHMPPNHGYHPGYPPSGYPPHQHPPDPEPVAPTPTSQFEGKPQWEPHYDERNKLDEWFHGLDRKGVGFVSGADMVPFMRTSNLNRDTLRAIWALVDNTNQGQVNGEQFKVIIRLISIACCPIFAGSKPTLERYFSTIDDNNINLPAALHLEVIAPPAPAPVAPAPAAAATTVTIPDDDEEFSDFSCAPTTPPPGGLTNALPNTFSSNSIGNAELNPFESMMSSAVDPVVANSTHQQQSSNAAQWVSPISQPTPMQPMNFSGPGSATLTNDDEFGDFDGPSTATITPSNAKGENDLVDILSMDHSSSSGVSPAANSNAVMSTPEEEEFDEFTSASSPSSVPSNIAAPLSPMGNNMLPAPSLLRKPSDSSISPKSSSNQLNKQNNKGGAPKFKFNISSVGPELHSPEYPIRNRGDKVETNYRGSNQWVMGEITRDHRDGTYDIDCYDGEKASNISANFVRDLHDKNNRANDNQPDVIMTVDTPGIETVLTSPNTPPAAANSMTNTAAAPVPATGMGSWNKNMSFLDDLIENDLQAMNEEWDDFADASTSPSKPSTDNTTTAPSTNNNNTLPASSSGSDDAAPKMDPFGAENDDDFGKFENFTPSNVTASALLKQDKVEQVAPSSISASNSSAAVLENNDDDDDFGDFEGGHVTSNDTSKTNTTAAATTTFVDDDDDFGDFSTHTEAKPAESSTSMSNGDSKILAQKASSTKLDLSDNLLDFLSDDVYIPASNATALPKPATTAASSSGGLLDLLDFMDDTPVAPTPVTPPKAALPPPIVSKKLTVKSPTRENKDNFMEKRSMGKLMSLQQLQALSVTLAEKRLYEDAYACAMQTVYLRRMSDEVEKKEKAVESGDTAAAAVHSKNAADMAALLEGKEEETGWVSRSQPSFPKGSSLNEIADFIRDVGGEVGERFKTKYISILPVESAPIEDRMRAYVIAKRSAKIIAAVLTSHKDRPKQWAQILAVVSKRVNEGAAAANKFRTLKENERGAILGHLRMQGYIDSLVRMTELGMYLCASCEEALVHEKDAKILYKKCSSMLEIVATVWGVRSELRGKTCDDLIVESGVWSERSGVIYCNLTLRALAVRGHAPKALAKAQFDVLSHSSGLQNSKGDEDQYLDLCTSYVKKNDLFFMKAAINIWIFDIAKSDTLPHSDSNFT